MNNVQIAELLRAVAAAYEIKDQKKNRFKIIAYERAADAVEHLSSEAKDLWDDKKLEKVGGIGESIASHLDEIFRTGKSKHFERLMKGLPPAMFDLMKVSGIGAKTAYKLAKELKISDKKPLKQLENLAKKGKIEKLEGFGKDSEESILKSLDEEKGREKRMLISYALGIAEEIVNYLKKDKNIQHVDTLGSLRRRASTVGDIDISAASEKPKEAIKRFTEYPKRTRVLEKGDRTASIILPGNIQVDFMVQGTKSYGSLLQHFTGSKHHNIALREYALKKGMSLSEYGIKKNGKLTKCITEQDFYKKLGMDFIPPELREDTGEIDAAINHKLPKLLELGDIKSDLQIHSSFDIETSHDLGESSMEELITKANALGYEYIAFTEHNPSHSKHSEKQIIDLIKRKREKIDNFNSSLVKSYEKGIKKVFNSLEIDMLPSGKLPVPEKGLELLDFALISIHSSFQLSREKMTKRVLTAFEHPKVKVFAHPTARKLNHREGVELEWQKIFEYCLKNKKYLEVNAEPLRQDLPDTLVKEAVGKGVKMTMGTDSHNVDSMDNMKYGVFVARRGWATKSDILNTLSLEEFEKMIK